MIRTMELADGYNIIYAEGENVMEALGFLGLKIRKIQETFDIVAVHGSPNWKQDDMMKILYIATQALTLATKKTTVDTPAEKRSRIPK